jgi:hypothetical protein
LPLDGLQQLGRNPLHLPGLSSTRRLQAVA